MPELTPEQIAADYVPESQHDELLAKLAIVKAEVEKRQSELKEHERLERREAELVAKLKGYEHEESYIKTALDLGIDPDMMDEVYELSRVSADDDDAGMKVKLVGFLAEKPKFRAKPAPAKATPPRIPPGKFGYTHANLGDPEWMEKNSKAYVAAASNGRLHCID